MKLASLKHGRDGKLIVVNRQLTKYVDATDIAPTLQAALDNWAEAEPKLQSRFEALQNGEREGVEFNPADCASPLPRAFQWADGSAYVNHVQLVRQARGAELPDSFWEDPLMYQGGSDGFLGPQEDIPVGDLAWGCDLEAELAVVTGDVPYGANADEAAKHMNLFMLVNDVSLRGLIPGELAKGFGFFQSKPASAFGPVAVTADELGATWDGGRLHLPMLSWINGKPFGKPNAGVDMTFDFPTLVAHAAKSRTLGAGTIIGSGTISNRDPEGGPGKPIEDGGLGYSCIAEQRMIETIETGKPSTEFLKYGDTVEIEVKDLNGQSIFGRITQKVVPAK